MNITIVKQFFNHIYQFSTYQNNHGLPQMMSFNGLASIITYYLKNGIPDQVQTEQLLLNGFGEDKFLFCTVLFCLLIMVAVLSNPCQPFETILFIVSRHFSYQFISQKIGRDLMPWEYAIIDVAIKVILKLLYAEEINLRKLIQFAIGRIISLTLQAMLVYVVDQFVFQDKIIYYVMMGLGYLQVYGKDTVDQIKNHVSN